MKRRSTPAQKSILKLLETSNSAMSQDMIEHEIKGEVDRVTIYRILSRFCEDGIVHKVVSDEGKSYFALCRDCGESRHFHNHFHFKCLQCGTVECLNEQVSLQLPKGYTKVNMNCWVTGFCSKCREAA